VSLRRSSHATPYVVASSRHNAPQFTGPRTLAGRVRVRPSALPHGREARKFRETMTVLGEDPGEFDRLYQGLLQAYAPGDELWAQQVEDLAKLYWRRRRLERARDALLRREVESLEAEQRDCRREIERATFAPTEQHRISFAVPRPATPAARLRQRVSYLETIRERIKQQSITPRLVGVLQELYGADTTWRVDAITSLVQSLAREPQEQISAEDSDYLKLLQWLADEIVSARQEADLAGKQALEVSAAARDARLAPTGKEWTLIIRQENALDRAIDRKVRILMQLQRGGALPGARREAAGGAPRLATHLANNKGRRRAKQR
jgi:hypothetical protein